MHGRMLRGFVLAQFVLCTGVGSFAWADEGGVVDSAAEVSEPVIVVDGVSFWSWQDYTQSETFARKALRCGTVSSGVNVAVAAVAEGPQDCTFSLTNPDPAYDPSVELYRIPVVVHVIRTSSGATGHISEAMVQSQIDILNEDFLAMIGTNGANGTDIQIEFYLATHDPLGSPTNGITYSDNTTWYNDGGAYWNTLAWDTNRYLNIYTNSASGNLGYVPDLPQGGIAGSNADRVVVLWSSFGRNGPIGPPFNLGRTATHEVGHYFGLEHTFSWACTSPTACYTSGDLICDTNPQEYPTSGCPNASSCGSSDPVHNYLDYSNDSCMEEFTPDQARRMRCSLLFYRPDLFEIVGGAVCGNNIRETIEECDGADDAACPGACLADCHCPISCYVAAEPMADSAVPDAGFGTQNRTLSLAPQNPAVLTALRVTGPGWQAWVGEPIDITENAGSVDPASASRFPTFRAAPLACVPLFTDWTTEGVVHVYDESFVPGGAYTIEAVRANCDIADQSSYSAALNIRLSAWGDVVGAYDTGSDRWASPDGSVGVPTDVVAIVDKFQNRSGAPAKIRMDVSPGALDWIINISDVSYALDAFRGAAYPFPPAAAPCP